MPGQNMPSDNRAAPRLGRRRPLPSGPDCPALSVRPHSCEVSPEASGSCRHPERSEAGLQCRMRPSRRFPASPSPPRQIRSGFSAGLDMARPRIANPTMYGFGGSFLKGVGSRAPACFLPPPLPKRAPPHEKTAHGGPGTDAPRRSAIAGFGEIASLNGTARRRAAGRRPGGRSRPPTRGSITAWGRARRAALGGHTRLS